MVCRPVCVKRDARHQYDFLATAALGRNQWPYRLIFRGIRTTDEVMNIGVMAAIAAVIRRRRSGTATVKRH